MINEIILKKSQKIHFIGIGGISMSALAKLLFSFGKEVSGSDIKRSKVTDELKALGVKINIKHKAKAVEGADLVVYSGAIHEDNVEYKHALDLGISTLERSELLGIIASAYKNVIAIAGAHGKTTTTAMLAKVMIDAGLDPTVHLGGEADFLGGNFHIGSKDFFITEACEYRRSFLKLKPNYSIILNVEPEHLDTYHTFANVKKAFKKFALKTTDLVIYNKNYIMDTTKDFITFDIDKPSNVYVKNLRCIKGRYRFDVYVKDTFLHGFQLGIIGRHNVLNALAVITLCYKLNINMDIVASSLRTFTGVKRRFEKLGNYNNAEIIIDYAHHPTEINSLIDAVRGYYNGELIVVFQPHTYSRTALAFDDFISTFSRKEIDKLILFPTYSARESPRQGKSAMDLYKVLRNKLQNVKYCTQQNIYNCIKSCASSKTMILFVGAGDIDTFARQLFK